MGIAVFSGMLGVTLFGLAFTPLFYVLVRRLAAGSRDRVAVPSGIHPLQPLHPTVLQSSLAAGDGAADD